MLLAAIEFGKVIGGLALILIAWAVWEYLPMLPQFIRAIIAGILALLGLYLIVVGVAGDELETALVRLV